MLGTAEDSDNPAAIAARSLRSLATKADTAIVDSSQRFVHAMAIPRSTLQRI